MAGYRPGSLEDRERCSRGNPLGHSAVQRRTADFVMPGERRGPAFQVAGESCNRALPVANQSLRARIRCGIRLHHTHRPCHTCCRSDRAGPIRNFRCCIRRHKLRCCTRCHKLHRRRPHRGRCGEDSRSTQPTGPPEIRLKANDSSPNSFRASRRNPLHEIACGSLVCLFNKGASSAGTFHS